MRIFGFPKAINERLLCFDLLNAESVTVEAIDRFENQLCEHGVMAARFDVPSRTACVLVTDHAVDDEEVENLLRSIGLDIRRRAEGA